VEQKKEAPQFRMFKTTNTKLAAVLRAKFGALILVEGLVGPDEQGRITIILAYPEDVEEEVKEAERRFHEGENPEALMSKAIDEYRQLRRFVVEYTRRTKDDDE